MYSLSYSVTCLSRALLSINEGMKLIEEVSHHINHCSKMEFLSEKLPTLSYSLYPAIGARRVLTSNKFTCYQVSRHPCFIHLIHPRHLVPGWLEVGGVSEVAVDWWCHTLEYLVQDLPRNGISGYGRIFCYKNI